MRINMMLFVSVLVTACGAADSAPHEENTGAPEDTVGSVASPLPAAGTMIRLQSENTGRLVDSDVTGHAYTNFNNGGAYQKWLVGNGSYANTLKNKATGRCLDSDASGRVYTLPCNGGSYQEWYSWSVSSSQLWNVATGRCLDGDVNGSLYTLPCNGNTYQRWNYTTTN